MDCEHNINVKVLNKDDSWELFKKYAGNIVNTHVHEAKEIAQECGGLPIALVTLGRALRNKELSRWSEALEALKKSRHVDIRGMSEKVLSSIKLSFDYIESEEAKMCFLYCCLFPEDYDIKVENLVMFLIGEGLIDNIETFDEGRTRVRVIVDNLKASCLLLDGSWKRVCQDA